MSDTTRRLADELTDDELDTLVEMVQARNEGRLTRREVVKSGGLLAALGLGGGAAVGSASADASTSDSDGNIGEPGNRVDAFLDGADVNSVNTDDHTINNSVTYPDGTTITTSPDGSGQYFGPATITDDSSYASEPELVECDNGDVLAIYRTGTGHVDTSGKLVLKRYAGGSWGAEQTIVDNGSYDDRNPAVGIDESSGRIIVFYRETDASSNTIDTKYVTSTDNGSTWSSATSVASALSLSGGVPFGSLIKTSNGLMAAFYSDSSSDAEVLFSSDNGQSWGSGVNISSAADQYEEPTPLRIDNSRLIVYGRANDGFWYVTSSDGGSTWGTPTDVNTDFANIPVYASQTTGGTVVAVLGNRETDQIEAYWSAPDALWDDPSMLLDGGYEVVANAEGTGGIDFGYPKVAHVKGADTAVWYDGTSSDTDIYVSSLPTAGQRASPKPPEETSKTAGTTYQNTSERPLMVMPTWFNSGAGNVADVEGSISQSNSFNSDDIVIRDSVTAHDGTNVFASLSMVIPPGYYYKVEATGSRSQWWEHEL